MCTSVSTMKDTWEVGGCLFKGYARSAAHTSKSGKCAHVLNLVHKTAPLVGAEENAPLY